MNSAPAKMPWIGQSVTRLEDPPLVTGRGEFAGDINFPHQLHMRMVRSAHAHGRIVSLDLSAARALPGVFAVWSAADITEVPPVDFREGSIPALDPYRQPVLANGARALCRRAGRRGVRRRPLRRGRRRRSRHDANRGIAAAARCAGGAGGIFAGTQQRGGDHPPGLWRRRCRVPHAPSTSSKSSLPSAGIPACRWRRAAPSAVYDASRGILELHGAAKVPHRNQELLSRMLKIPPSGDPRPRIPCRRRLRHPRRALSRGRSGLRRREKNSIGR